MASRSRRQEWERRGYFVDRQGISVPATVAVRDEIISRIRSDPPKNHPDAERYFSGPDLHIFLERAPNASAINPEDQVSRVFNCHTQGVAWELANDRTIVATVEDLLGGELVCFQSQFVFKNPGAIGQPWHQDSFYFPFDRQPQVTVWIPLSQVTIENGCLWVVPGSHQGPIRAHVPDRRSGANAGYLEIDDFDDSGEMPVIVDPGDVLYFHSFLAHRAADNVANYRRVAIVLHYALAETKYQNPEAERALAYVNRWKRVERR